MKVQGSATFEHSKGPFNVMELSVEIVPDTAQEHEELKKVPGLDWDGAHCFLKVTFTKPYETLKVEEDAERDVQE